MATGLIDLLREIFGVGCSAIRAEETPTDIRPSFVDAAAPFFQEFTTVVYLQFMRSIERKLQASGSQPLKPFVLIPADFNAGKRAAADDAALPTSIITIFGCIKKNSVVSFLSEGREEHWYSPSRRGWWKS
jgi:hypothetical protein